MLFRIPLDWYAWANGVEIWNFYADSIPAWYEITNQFIWQSSVILLMPVWMIGLCLLYVDERVRHEGYDIELLAARRLGRNSGGSGRIRQSFASGFVAETYVANPPPNQSPTQPKKKSYSTLGLD